MSKRSKEYFNKHYEDYDDWYEEHPKEFSDQIDFIAKLLPEGRGIEIGVGTGRFASALGIGTGVDISEKMAQIAAKRGIDTIVADAVALPFRDNEFDFSLNMVTICFLDQPLETLMEARRISRIALTVILDRECEYVEHIISHRTGFYRFAKFYTRAELEQLYEEAGFDNIETSEKTLKTKEGFEYRLVGVLGS